MSWSKLLDKSKKPIKWWIAKIFAEFFYAIGNYKLYYYWLNYMCNNLKINLYGIKTTSEAKNNE